MSFMKKNLYDLPYTPSDPHYDTRDIRYSDFVNSCDLIIINDKSEVNYWITSKSLPCYKFIEKRRSVASCVDDPYIYEVQIKCRNKLHLEINNNRELYLNSTTNGNKINELLADQNRQKIENEIKENEIKENEKKEKQLIKLKYEEAYELINIPNTRNQISNKYRDYLKLVNDTKKTKKIITESKNKLKELTTQRLAEINHIKKLKKSEYFAKNNFNFSDEDINKYKLNKTNCIVCKIGIVDQNSKCENFANPEDNLIYYFVFLMNYELCFTCFNYKKYIYCFLCNEFTEFQSNKNGEYFTCRKCFTNSGEYNFYGYQNEKYWKPGAATNEDKRESLLNYNSRIRYKNRNRYTNSYDY